MAILDTLVDVEKSLLGVVGDTAELATDTAGAVVKTAAQMVHEVIEALGGVVKND